ARAPGQEPDLLGDRLGKVQLVVSGVKILERRPRPVRREVEAWRYAIELALPVGKLFVECLAREPVPLPGGEVRILERQLWQRRRTPRHKRGVERRQLLQQQS